MSDLESNQNNRLEDPDQESNSIVAHHPHLGEVQEAVVREVGRALLDEVEVGQVHAKVGNTRRIGPVQGIPEIPMPPVGRHQALELLDSLSRLEKRYIVDLVGYYCCCVLFLPILIPDPTCS